MTPAEPGRRFAPVGFDVAPESYDAFINEYVTNISRTGVFVRIKGEQELVSGDEVMVGRTRMQLDVLP